MRGQWRSVRQHTCSSHRFHLLCPLAPTPRALHSVKRYGQLSPVVAPLYYEYANALLKSAESSSEASTRARLKDTLRQRAGGDA